MEGWMELGRMKEEGMGELVTSIKLFNMEGVYEHPFYSPLLHTQPITREASGLHALQAFVPG